MSDSGIIQGKLLFFLGTHYLTSMSEDNLILATLV